MLPERYCDVCGKKFRPRQYNQRACSTECARILKNADTQIARESYNSICPICGRKIEGHKKYCSDECKMVGSKLRALENGYEVEVESIAVNPCTSCRKVGCTTACVKFEKYFVPAWDEMVADLRKKLNYKPRTGGRL